MSSFMVNFCGSFTQNLLYFQFCNNFVESKANTDRD